jgi:hypothetical protein
MAMDHSDLFYFVFGVSVVAFPAIADRLLKHRVPEWVRAVVGLVVAVLTGVVLVVLSRTFKF